MSADNFPIFAAAFTPTNEDGNVNLDLIPALVDHFLTDGVQGIFATGSTGGGMSLTGIQRRQVAEAFCKASAGRLQVIVQVGHNSVAEASELAAHAKEIAADGVAATPPSYFKPGSVPMLVECIQPVAAAAADLPFYYYNIPRFTGVQLDMVELIQHAGSAIPNFRGMKYSAKDVAEFQLCSDQSDDRFQMFWGGDDMLLSAVIAGADGAIGGTYNFAAPLYIRMVRALHAGDVATARHCQSHAARMMRVLNKFGGLPASRAVMKLLGLDCGPSLLPLETLNGDEIDALQRELESLGFFERIRSES